MEEAVIIDLRPLKIFQILRFLDLDPLEELQGKYFLQIECNGKELVLLFQAEN